MTHGARSLEPAARHRGHGAWALHAYGYVVLCSPIRYYTTQLGSRDGLQLQAACQPGCQAWSPNQADQPRCYTVQYGAANQSAYAPPPIYCHCRHARPMQYATAMPGIWPPPARLPLRRRTLARTTCPANHATAIASTWPLPGCSDCRYARSTCEFWRPTLNDSRSGASPLRRRTAL